MDNNAFDITLNSENMHYDETAFRKWIMHHPTHFSKYLNRQLNKVDVVKKDDTIYLYGDNHQYIDLSYVEYDQINDFITIPELIENKIINNPIFIIQVDMSEGLYCTEQRIVGVTNNYSDALRIADQYCYPTIDIAKLNEPIDIYAGAYTE